MVGQLVRVGVGPPRSKVEVALLHRLQEPRPRRRPAPTSPEEAFPTSQRTHPRSFPPTLTPRSLVLLLTLQDRTDGDIPQSLPYRRTPRVLCDKSVLHWPLGL